MKKLILTTLAFAIITSCSRSSENDSNTNFPYQGHWTGTFTGNKDKGTFYMDIDSKGTITGKTTSSVYQDIENVTGNVSQSGKVSAVAGNSTSGANFTGEMNNNSASGTWVNSSVGMNGTWQGTKN